MNKTVAVLLLLSISACAPTSSSTNSNGELVNGIINGKNVDAKDPIAKSTVAVKNLSLGLCTGILISERVVLTAAHCIKSPTNYTTVQFGLDASTAKTVPVKFAKQHDGYQDKTDSLIAEMEKIAGGLTDNERFAKISQLTDSVKDWNDIAVLYLSEKAPSGFVPASIIEDRALLAEGATVSLAGYGITKPSSEFKIFETDTEILRKVDVPVADGNHSATEVKLDQTFGGACHSDSGGPGFIKENDVLKVFGLTSRSFSDPGDTCKTFSIYTYIPAYSDWIKATVTEFENLEVGELTNQ